MLYCVRSSFGPQKTKFESSTCTIKNLSNKNENINLKMSSFLWYGNLPNRASKIKRLLARHDIHLPRASGQVLSYTSDNAMESSWSSGLPRRFVFHWIGYYYWAMPMIVCLQTKFRHWNELANFAAKFMPNFWTWKCNWQDRNKLGICTLKCDLKSTN